MAVQGQVMTLTGVQTGNAWARANRLKNQMLAKAKGKKGEDGEVEPGSYAPAPHSW